jgi:hypothetical protein
MQLSDMHEDQKVALVKQQDQMKKGSIGYTQGYSSSRAKVLVKFTTGEEIYCSLDSIIGVLQ